MSKLRRVYGPDQLYFVTSVTQGRARILIDHFEIFGEAVRRTMERLRFEVIAWVVVPDHFHMLVDPRDGNLSGILRRLKLSFAHQYLLRNGVAQGTVWQRRFWDHVIRDQGDMNRHIDYIHYNPVKHGLTSNPFQWRYSSIRRFAEDGFYAPDWGTRETRRFEGDFGE